MVIRGFQRIGKLGFTPISSISDLAFYMSATNFQGRGLLTGIFESSSRKSSNNVSIEGTK